MEELYFVYQVNEDGDLLTEEFNGTHEECLEKKELLEESAFDEEYEIFSSQELQDLKLKSL